MQFFLSLIEVSIAMSVIALVYIVSIPILRKFFSAKGLYYVWLIIIIGLIIPFRIYPEDSFVAIHPIMLDIKTMNSDAIGNTIHTISTNISWPNLFYVLWLAGVIIFISVYIVRHRRFLKMVKRWSYELDDEQMIEFLHEVKGTLRIKSKVKIQVCPGISSPMIIGFIRPTILLPTDKFCCDEFMLILKHELVHFKRKDAWYKLLVFLATALHWFNPFVHIIARAISIQCEISCDEEVVKNTSIYERQKYVEAIIGVIKTQSEIKSTFSANLYNGKQGLKQRVYSIMDFKNKKYGLSILVIVMIATFCTGIVVSIDLSDSSPIASKSNEIQQDSKGREDLEEDYFKIKSEGSVRTNNVSDVELNPPILIRVEEE